MVGGGASYKGRAGAAVAGAALSLALGLVGLICSAATCCCGLCGKVRGLVWLGFGRKAKF